MELQKFWFYNILGALVWSFGISLAGYFLGSVIDVDKYLLPIVLLIIFLSFLPGIIEFWRERQTLKQQGGTPVEFRD
jgi:membrane-associated protein